MQPCSTEIPALYGCFNIGDTAPDFCAPAYYCGRQIEVCLRDFRGMWLLLFFYSSDFTFV